MHAGVQILSRIRMGILYIFQQKKTGKSMLDGEFLPSSHALVYLKMTNNSSLRVVSYR